MVNDTHDLTSTEALEARYGTPTKRSRSKVQDHLTPAMQQWLSHAPFFIICTAGDTSLDCSPRGDQPGRAFTILDSHTLAIPDRRGNNRIDTLRNLIKDPRIGMIFLIPGVEQTIRIKGRARISVSPSLLDAMTLDGTSPATVILVEVEEAYVQNARAIQRAGLWRSDQLTDPESIPDALVLSR